MSIQKRKFLWIARDKRRTDGRIVDLVARNVGAARASEGSQQACRVRLVEPRSPTRTEPVDIGPA